MDSTERNSLSIDAAKAIEIGKKYGLNLSDIRALRELASDEETAEVYAAEFGEPTPDLTAEANLLADLAAITAKRGDPNNPYPPPVQPGKRLKSGNDPDKFGVADPLADKISGMLGITIPEDGLE